MYVLCTFYVRFFTVFSGIEQMISERRQLMLLIWMVVQETPAVVSSEWTTWHCNIPPVTPFK